MLENNQPPPVSQLMTVKDVICFFTESANLGRIRLYQVVCGSSKALDLHLEVVWFDSRPRYRLSCLKFWCVS
jgi:hypothetical protein